MNQSRLTERIRLWHIYEPNKGGNPTKNPFAKETFNLTEQGKMFKENPAQAKELAAAAGVTI